MKKINTNTLRINNESILKNSTSINQHSFTKHSLTSQLEFVAHGVIRKYNSLKALKYSQKNQRKLNKVYSNLMSIIYRLLGEKFDSEVGKDLIYILNRLVFAYESQPMQVLNKENETKTQNVLNKRNASNELKQSKANQLNMSSNIETQVEKMPKLRTKLVNLTQIQQSSCKKSQQFRVFLYERLKKQRNMVTSQREWLNQEIAKINNRISAAYVQMEEKIRMFELKRIIEQNRVKFELKEREKICSEGQGQNIKTNQD